MLSVFLGSVLLFGRVARGLPLAPSTGTILEGRDTFSKNVSSCPGMSFIPHADFSDQGRRDGKGDRYTFDAVTIGKSVQKPTR